MSHEIRTPLNGILGFSELLKKKNLSSEKRHFYTDIIWSNGKQLLNIISDIIDISRIESGQVSIEKSSCHVKGMMEELFEYLKTELRTKGKLDIETELNTDFLQPGFSFLCDEIHLRQIMVNLLSNAVKFTTSGKITFGYEIKPHEVEFYVRDTGIGIKPEYHSVIFERFRQANDSASREHGGTGLGLAICKNLVELMDGKIWLSPEVDDGSEFRVQLPSESISLTEPFPLEVNPLTNCSWPGKKILVVEDDIPSFQLIKETLNETYAVIYHADDGEKASLMHKSIKPDVILMDIRLPIINGHEAIQSIRKNDHEVPIIAITANAFNEDKINCLAAGADDYISKPVNQHELLSKINLQLEKSKEPKTTIKALEG
jgi:CheY-like chemotaxis protein